MARRIGLRTRLARLEMRQRHRRQLPTIITGIYPEEQPGPIIGIEGDGKIVRLKERETLQALQARAAAEIPARFLNMRYGAPAARQSDVAAPTHSPAPEPAPVDPFALAGVGKRASRQQLIEMGTIPVPPERLV